MVQVDGEDWRDIKRRVGQLEKDHVALKSSIDGLVKQQMDQHAENRTDISRIKVLLEGEGEGEPGIKLKLDRVVILVTTRFDDVLKAIKLIGWAVGIGLICVGLWFTSLELRHKLNTESQRPPVTLNQQPQDAAIPPLRK